MTINLKINWNGKPTECTFTNIDPYSITCSHGYITFAEQNNAFRHWNYLMENIIELTTTADELAE